MPRLLIITPRELTRDVRARREAQAARRAGVSVTGLCVSMVSETPLELAQVPIVRIGGDHVSGTLRNAGLGGLRSSGSIMRELRGLWRLARLAKTTARLVRAGRPLGRFDVVHANDLDALPAGYALARQNRARLVYDAHELYRFMETNPPRLYTALASAFEGWIGRRSSTVVTNCDLFALELERLLRLSKPAVVVLNCPDALRELPLTEFPASRVRAIYQAAADHPGRPVSDLLLASEHAPDVEITIRLVQLDEKLLARELEERGLAERVLLSEPVSPDRLVDGLAGFHIGVIVNRDATPNVALAVPGKLWEYMMAGLASVVPALPGLAFVEELGVGTTFPPGEPELMGRALQELATNRPRLLAMQQRARELALDRFNSEIQAELLRAAWEL